jgi:ELWxxDGT repeat protein
MVWRLFGCILAGLLSSQLLAQPLLLKDLYASDSSFSPQGFTDVNGTLFFTTSYSRELWKSDGTAAGTVKIATGLNADHESFTSVNGTLFFASGNKASGWELWKSDGTAAGTGMVKDIYPGGASSTPRYFTGINGSLYFWADDGTNGFELWKSDGTPAGTVLVKDINPGTDGSFEFGSFFSYALFNGSFYFRARTVDHGYELWKSDGTSAGTVMVKDINPGAGDSGPGQFAAVNGTLFFTLTNVHF